MLYEEVRRPPDLIKREIITDIQPYLFDDHIIVIIGPRQAGKTCLLHLLAELLLKEENISQDQIHYFDLEDIDTLSYFNSISPAALASQFREKERTFLFIDEVQYLDNPSNLLKIIHDHFPHIKLIVSGSSTLAIKKKFKESLTGRKAVFNLRTLSFDEFLRFKGSHLLKVKRELDWRRPEGISSLLAKEFFEFFQEFILFGGYPKVVLENNREKKVAQLSKIYNSYIRKDIKDLGAVENVAALNRLVSLLAFQIGQIINIEELTANLRISRKTVERYIFLLENTFAIHLLKPYFTNKRKEISKMPKVYFEDTGLRNVIIKNLDPLSLRNDSGFLFENAVFNTLIKRLKPLEELKFWRTQAGAEVDLHCLNLQQGRFLLLFPFSNLDYSKKLMTPITLLLLALPSGVSLVSMGLAGPNPLVLIR
ncbi:ATP-binding protein [bacterium]|nr:ATP-binding protein [bacterium]